MGTIAALAIATYVFCKVGVEGTIRLTFALIVLGLIAYVPIKIILLLLQI